MEINPNLDWKTLQSDATLVDFHVHPSLPYEVFRLSLNRHYRFIRPLAFLPLFVHASFPDMRQGDYDVALSVVYVPEKGLFRDFPIANLMYVIDHFAWRRLIAPSPFQATMNVLDDMENVVRRAKKKHRVKVAHSINELDQIVGSSAESRTIALVHCVEGAHSLTGDDPSDDETTLNNLEALFDRGVAYLTLAHFFKNAVVHPCYPYPEFYANLAPPNAWRDLTLGLTPLGRKVVRRMIELGMMIDLTHSTPTARQEVYDIVDEIGKPVPLLATHVGAYEINPSAYNLTNWEIKRIARDGGFIGVIFMPFWLKPTDSGMGLDFVARTIQHLIEVGGEDVVGIGTDFDGFSTPTEDLANASQMKRLTQRLLVDGHGQPLIKKILGGNAWRVLHAGWGRTG